MPTQEMMPTVKEALFKQGDTAPVLSWTLSTNLYSAYIVAKAGKQIPCTEFHQFKHAMQTAMEIAIQYSQNRINSLEI